MTKKILLGISLFLAIASSVYLYTYKGHRDISSETADYVVTISQLKKEFTSNGSLAYAKYQDKTIELTAQITTIDAESIGVVLDDKVFAIFKDSLPKNIASGKTIKIKGRFLGYDELLEVFKIDQCTVTH
jgi:Flp pilus assembly protein TadG